MDRPRAFRKSCRLQRTAGLGAVLAALTLAAAAPARAGSPPQNACDAAQTNGASVRDCTALIANGRLDGAALSRIFAGRAAAWMAEEEPAAAISDFSRAIIADPANLAAVEGRARAYAAHGRYDHAAADWSRILELMPSADTAFAGRAAAKLSDGKVDEAIGDFTSAVRLNPDNRDAILGRASIYDKLNQHDKALSDLALILERDPSYVPALFAKAEMADRWGEKIIAIECYRAVLKYQHYNQAARKALFRLSMSSLP
jgi:tetratricopeptide (TPR) repeat protein